MPTQREFVLFGSTALLAALLAATAVPAPLAAQEVSFAGKKISVMIGFSPVGIGYDTYGRVLARHMGRHLPGNPSMVPENKPGAGSMSLANFVYNAAPKDGTVIALVGRGVAMDKLLNGERATAKFDAAQFNWIGSLNNEVAGFFIRDGAPAKSLKDMMGGVPMRIASNGAGSDSHIFTAAVNTLLGTKNQIIPGFPGMNEILLAMDRGEMDGVAGYSWSTARVGSADKIKSGAYKLVLQLALAKHPELPHVPVIAEMVTSADDRKVLDLIFARQLMGRPVVAPPGLDPKVVAELRKAFDATVKDPEFLADCAKIGLEIVPVSGQKVQSIVADLFKLPTSVVERAQAIVRQ